MGYTIKQITPAEPGYRVVYNYQNIANTVPVVCWALCEQDGETFIAPACISEDSTVAFLDIVTWDHPLFWFMLKPGEDLPTEDEIEAESARRHQDLELRKLKSGLLLDIVGKPAVSDGQFLPIMDDGWIIRTERLLAGEAGKKPEMAEKLAVYKARVKEFSNGNHT